MHLLSHHQPERPGRLKAGGGFVLLEAAISSVVVSAGLVALLSLFIMLAKANVMASETQVASQLAAELLEEVKLRKWDQSQPAARPGYPAYAYSALGPDAGENPSDKRTFNDIDDFNGWTEHPPMDPGMNALAGFQAYSRTVSVQYVGASLQPSAVGTDYKLVTACASRGGAVQSCVSWLGVRH